jgi:hypothetical protein
MIPKGAKNVPSLRTHQIRDATEGAERSVAYNPGTDGSNPVPSSRGSVSGLNSSAEGEEFCGFAAVCSCTGTTRPFLPFSFLWRSLARSHPDAYSRWNAVAERYDTTLFS